MATTRMTFGAVLSTVTNTANAVSDAVNTVGDAIGMANSFVNNAAIDQKERQVAHRAIFRSQLIRESSMEIAKGNAEALAFARESDDNAKLFTEAQDLLSAAFDAFDGKKS